MSSLDTLAQLVASGFPDKESKANVEEQTNAAMSGIFGERYHSKSPHAKRVRLMSNDDNVSFAGFLHPDNPSSGVYGGTSLIWFPIAAEDGEPGASLLTLVCGTRGLSPDEHILSRPGHSRHLRALQRYLAKELGVSCWVKHNPIDLAEPFPRVIQDHLQRFESVFKRYGNHIYFCVEMPSDPSKAKAVFKSLFDVYAMERNWTPLKSCAKEIEDFQLTLRAYLFPQIESKQVAALLAQRRFVILQGPPGTGKTRMANGILNFEFAGKGFTVQFHPAVSYESFIAGISPRVQSENLNFEVKPGWLIQAMRECGSTPFLLVIDEINRADLSRVLGEAIYLLEPKEISQGTPRSVRLTNPLDSGEENIFVPPNLFILGTMNSADRSIAIMDMAVRRRFAFIDIWPDIKVVSEQGLPLATEAFAKLQDIFTQYATQDSFALLPGHSYFLADSESEFASRMKYDLLPLLDEYLIEGRVSGCETELRAYMDWLRAEV